jgi:hypothetical protein
MIPTGTCRGDENRSLMIKRIAIAFTIGAMPTISIFGLLALL